ncbi:NADPH--quinone oxidoreductase [Streptomyces sp. NBRC 110611]|uniref:hypothetical protein n=1 Tax=Streptomyces sp. NBRC 110611 TaxID=1621259 RepID=UPI00082B1E17|nr:hypothetical protein [Streptomyces sp. NBRC 110611]GAU71143.1 NADPH--quinone oxidoreductase [Streptomyces sp. NBRC 110611]
MTSIWRKPEDRLHTGPAGLSNQRLILVVEVQRLVVGVRRPSKAIWKAFSGGGRAQSVRIGGSTAWTEDTSGGGRHAECSGRAGTDPSGRTPAAVASLTLLTVCLQTPAELLRTGPESVGRYLAGHRGGKAGLGHVDEEAEDVRLGGAVPQADVFEMAGMGSGRRQIVASPWPWTV